MAILGYLVYLNSGAIISEDKLRDAAIERARVYVEDRFMNAGEKERVLPVIKKSKVTRTHSETYLVEMKAFPPNQEQISSSIDRDSIEGNHIWEIECQWSGNQMEILHAQSYFEDDIE